MDPLPTILRAVSGNRKIMRTKQSPEARLRNQNIQVHPAA
jgi:hypothetical protein